MVVPRHGGFVTVLEELRAYRPKHKQSFVDKCPGCGGQNGRVEQFCTADPFAGMVWCLCGVRYRIHATKIGDVWHWDVSK